MPSGNQPRLPSTGISGPARKRWPARSVGVISCAAAILWLAGCASSNSASLLLDPVGPRSGMPFRPAKTQIPGQLQVYTLAHSVNDGGIEYDPNTPYDVFNADGRFVIHVRNSFSDTDQVAEIVSLPGGLYFVRALAPALGTVMIPVLIMPEQLTFANVQQLGQPRYQTDLAGDWVRLPSGWPVGRKAVFEVGAEPPQLKAPPALVH